MRNWPYIAGLFFMGTASVYPVFSAFADDIDHDAIARTGGNSAVAIERPIAAATNDSSPTTAPATQLAIVGATSIRLNDAGSIEMHLSNAPLTEVLRVLSSKARRNVVATKEVRGTVSANLYDVTLAEALGAVLRPNGYEYREQGNFIYVYSAKELADLDKHARKKSTEVFRLHYTPAANAVAMLKPVLSAEGQIAFTAPAESGIPSDAAKAGGNTHAGEDVLVVTDYAENIQAASKVIKEVDQRPQQILIEATILRATLNETNSLGVNFTALGGVDFSSLSLLSNATPATESGVSQALTGDIANNPSASSALKKGYVAGAVGGNGIQFGIVRNNIGLFIQALEGVTDTVIVANPKVLVLNKQRGEVHVGDDQGYRTSITTETTTATNVQFLQTGTHLIFRPFVGDDGYIRLEIHPEDSAGSVDANGVPSKSVTEVTTNVMVKDGHTIVIGGLFRESTSRTRNQAPGLGSIPGIGAAFRNQSDVTVREEVIILLTPRLIKDDRAYSDASQDQLRNAERMRVGLRKGLMPWGRERLAESWYEDAVHQMNKPDPNPGRAMFDLNCAINLHPEFSEAMEMRAQISGREAHASDGSSIRLFLRKQIMEERAAALAPGKTAAHAAIESAALRDPMNKADKE